MSEAIDILTDALAIIRRKGWTRGSYQSAAGCVCAAGAIKIAAGYTHSCTTPSGDCAEAFRLLQKVIRPHAPMYVGEGDILTWNDSDERTKADVILAFIAAGARE